MAFNPNRNKVGDVLDALAAAAQFPSTVQAPTWLGDAGPTEASEIFACANGLLHMPTRNCCRTHPHSSASTQWNTPT